MNMNKPNILFIMTDQESVSLSGCYGNAKIKTPTRDSIAENGIRFENHYIASFPCTPSRATMITGLYAHNHGLVTNGIVLDERIETLGSQLGRAGYDTTWIGKSHMGGWFEPDEDATCPYHELQSNEEGYSWIKHPRGAGGEDYRLNGFQTWISGWSHYRNYLQNTDLPDEIKRDRWVGGHQVMQTGPDSEHAYSRLTEKHHMANWMSGEAIKTLDITKESKNPFCMVLSYYAPHHPIAPPKPYDTMYKAEEMELPESYRKHPDAINLPGMNQENKHNNYIADQWTDDQAKAYLARYYGYVTYLDDQMARVFEALKETGQYENTIVLFSSDHGDMLCEQGMIYKHCFNGFDTLMKVPMTMQWPAGLKAGQVQQGLTSHIDLLPTLLELAGVEQSADVDGESLAKALKSESPSTREQVFLDVMNQGYMTRKGQWKFVLNVSCVEGDITRKVDELYDMENDPKEMKNLISSDIHLGLIESLKNDIFSWLKDSRHPHRTWLKKLASEPMLR
jgi:arylsulfatase